jgi:hypothetical protein
MIPAWQGNIRMKAAKIMALSFSPSQVFGPVKL